MRHRGGRVLALALLLVAGAARAQSEDPDEEIARRHFKQGSAFYLANDYARALAEFELAARAHPAPALDFNIARCHDRLEHADQAIAYYRKYLTSSPKDAAEIQARIEKLQPRAAPLRPAQDRAEPPKPPIVPAAAPVENEPPRRSWKAPIGLGVATLAVAITGVALVGSVVPDYDRLDGPGGCRPCTPSQFSDLQTRAYSGYALLGLAGALAVVDVVLFVINARRPAAPREARR
jgi:tetratricopeptide (TPR) repeat protein